MSNHDTVRTEGSIHPILFQRKLLAYEDEEWLPRRSGEDEEEEEEGKESEAVAISKTILDDLGNKFTGHEMDTIARHVLHGYHLRSLHQPLQSDRPKNPNPPEPAPITNPQTSQPHVTAVDCPYVIPKPHLPPPPTPKGTTANDYYEALDARDQEIRKGEQDPFLMLDIIDCWYRYEEADFIDGGGCDCGNVS